jgi:TPR repeat protein
MYQEGSAEVERNLRKAMDLFEKAAAQENEHAQ